MAVPVDKIILGIDPGTVILGYGLIRIRGKEIELISHGVIKLAKLGSHPDRLKRIFERVNEIITNYKPDEVAIEAPFFGKNVQSMLKLGRAQGVAMAAALHRNIPIEEYSPKKIKQSITGNGNASKEQVAEMLKRLLKFKENPEHFDSTDGLAAAVCHYFQGGIGHNNAAKKSLWKSFISDNPSRLKKR